MENKSFEMKQGIVYSRKNLASMMGVDDRSMRSKVREMRRNGIPVVSIKGGGYKIAETSEEKMRLLNMYRSRAFDELCTVQALLKNMTVENQIGVTSCLKDM